MIENSKLFLKNVDLFGRERSFEEEDLTEYKTYVGSVMTITTLVLCVVMSFLFGKEIYEKKHPNVVQSFDILPWAKINTDTDFPVFIVHLNNLGKPINVTGYLDVNITSIVWTNSEGYISQAGTVTEIDLDTYDMSNYPEEYQNLYKDVFQQWKNNGFTGVRTLKPMRPYFQDDFATMNSTMLNIRVLRCKGEARCKSEEEIDAFLSNGASADIFFPSSYVDSKNYSNPIQYISKNMNVQLNEKIAKRYFLRLSKDRLVSDNGWILEDNKEYEHITLVEDKFEIMGIIDNNYLSFTFESPVKVNVVYRNYMKIQDLLAKIGGFFNTIVIVFKILSTNYLKFRYKLDLLNDISNKTNNNGINLHNIVKLSDSKFELIKENNLGYNNQNSSPQNNNLKSLNYVNKLNNFVQKDNNQTDEKKNDNADDKSFKEKIEKVVMRSTENEPNKTSQNLVQDSLYLNKENQFNIIKNKEEIIRNLRKSYFEYFTKDIICCNNLYAPQIALADKILSFHDYCYSVYSKLQ